MTEAEGEHRAATLRPCPGADDRPGWYPDPGDERFERYWTGAGFEGGYRRRRALEHRWDAPPTTGDSVAKCALIVSGVSLALPAAFWVFALEFPKTHVSRGVGDVLVLACLCALLGSLVGFVMGIVKRHDRRGVVAILLALVAGPLSAVTLVGLVLASALSAMNGAL